MKLVCPFCKGRALAVYTREPVNGKTQFVALANYLMCDKDGMIYEPTWKLDLLDDDGSVSRTIINVDPADMKPIRLGPLLKAYGARKSKKR
ncbi:MAG TPA: hypothetical protein VGV89_09290 [Thermoplasmata archaeon]|nr:hypothetical protein [Thermoplasmata archaeon]